MLKNAENQLLLLQPGIMLTSWSAENICLFNQKSFSSDQPALYRLPYSIYTVWYANFSLVMGQLWSWFGLINMAPWLPHLSIIPPQRTGTVSARLIAIFLHG